MFHAEATPTATWYPSPKDARKCRISDAMAPEHARTLAKSAERVSAENQWCLRLQCNDTKRLVPTRREHLTFLAHPCARHASGGKCVPVNGRFRCAMQGKALYMQPITIRLRPSPAKIAENIFILICIRPSGLTTMTALSRP